MKRLAILALVLITAVASFAAGAWLAGRTSRQGSPGGERRILHWVDPMNPALISEKPGIAPCGMPLEPVYADEDPGARAAAAKLASMPPGSVRIAPDRQQIIGVRFGTVERKPLEATIRLTARVVPDETRLFRITSVTDGWIRELSPATTGSFVRKDDILGRYYSQEVQGPQQAYLYALEALDRFRASGAATPDQITLNENNVRNARQSLRNLGMGDVQLDEIATTRKPSPTVAIRAPADGIVLERNVTLGQQFDRTLDLFVIADLSRIWILADAFEEDAHHLAPGTVATVWHPGFRKRFAARVGSVPPVFDPASRTLKVRLLADNPGAVLRPEMFVDVELPVRENAILTVPADAVLDSGSKRTVFVDRGEGLFEPRSVEIGRRYGDAIEIESGLMEGERIVVSGNFLIDSESRMKTAVGGMARPASRDPICGMDVDEAAARADGRFLEHDGRTIFFCAPGCKDAYTKKLAAESHAHD